MAKVLVFLVFGNIKKWQFDDMNVIVLLNDHQQQFRHNFKSLWCDLSTLSTESNTLVSMTVGDDPISVMF